MSTIPQLSIHVVVIGYARSNGIKTMPRTFENTPYVMTAFLDLFDSPKRLQYDQHNLETVLNSLYPRPRALIIGPAIHPSKVGEIRTVWTDFIGRAPPNEQELNDQEKYAFVSLPDFKYIDPQSVKGPPPDLGWDAEMFRQLDVVFARHV